MNLKSDTPVNEEQIQKLVDQAVALHREVATKTEQLKALKASLVQEARAHPGALLPTESGGKRWTVKGTDGCIARVNFPAAALLSEVEADCDRAKQIRAVAGETFRHLFTTVKIYQLVENFRAEAAALLPTKKAEALTSLCETESAPRVSFETTKRAEADGNA